MVVGGPWGQALHRQGFYIWLKVLNLPKVAAIARFQPIRIHPCRSACGSHRWKTSLVESDKIYGHQNARAILRCDFADTDDASAYWRKICTYKLTAWPARMASSSDPRIQPPALTYQVELAPALALLPRGPSGHPCFLMPTSTTAGTGII